MAASPQHDNDSGITGINVTPLVDVMLVLLVVFMVTANLVNNKTVELNLPQASTGTERKPTVIKIAVTKDGELTLDGKALELKDLTSSVSSIKDQADKGQRISVELAADRLAPHGKVIDVIDNLRKAGIEDLGFAVQE